MPYVNRSQSKEKMARTALMLLLMKDNPVQHSSGGAPRGEKHLWVITHTIEFYFENMQAKSVQQQITMPA